jgi:hypothetical protein
MKANQVLTACFLLLSSSTFVSSASLILKKPKKTDVDRVVTDFSSSDFANLTIVNQIFSLLTENQKRGIFPTLSSTIFSAVHDVGTFRRPPVTSDQGCQQGRLVVSIKESERGLKKLKPATLTDTDPPCQLSPDALRTIFQDPTEDELSHMSALMQCPVHVQDVAMSTFLQVAPVESVMIFFDFVDEGGDLLKLLISRQEFTLKALTARSDNRSTGQLIEFFEGKGLFSDAIEEAEWQSVKKEICSQLHIDSIEKDAQSKRSDSDASNDPIILNLVKRLWFPISEKEHLPAISFRGGTVHPIHFAVGRATRISPKYFEFIAPLADYTCKLGHDLDTNEYAKSGLPQGWHLKRADQIAAAVVKNLEEAEDEDNEDDEDENDERYYEELEKCTEAYERQLKQQQQQQPQATKAVKKSK